MIISLIGKETLKNEINKETLKNEINKETLKNEINKETLKNEINIQSEPFDKKMHLSKRPMKEANSAE